MNNAARDEFLATADKLDIYRRMFGTADGSPAAWWYFGTSFVELDGYPALPVLHIETLMINKAVTLTPDSLRLDWWEIGYMRDPTTGEVAKSWKNPITGAVLSTPQKFEEGPSHFLVERAGAGLRLKLEQAHARVESVDVDFSVHGDRVLIEQTERKVRGFPLPDGSMPSLDSPHVSPAHTTLRTFSAIADLSRNSTPSSGAYEFQLAPPAWMGFGDMPGRSITRGIMVKARMNEKLNPIAWDRMREFYPDCFEGDEVKPRWATGQAPGRIAAKVD